MAVRCASDHCRLPACLRKARLRLMVSNYNRTLTASSWRLVAPATPSPSMGRMVAPTRKVLLARPRGYCAGVERAVQAVERALELYGAPVYVRKQIVHNTHVVRILEKRGAIFVEETEEVPEGSVVVFSAHGVAPQVRDAAKDQ